MADSGTALRIHQLSAGYGHNTAALHQVSLSVPSGRVTAIVGPNGAGKSTLMKVLAGIHPSSHGSIELFGQAVDGRALTHGTVAPHEDPPGPGEHDGAPVDGDEPDREDPVRARVQPGGLDVDGEQAKRVQRGVRRRERHGEVVAQRARSRRAQGPDAPRLGAAPEEVHEM